VEAHPHPIDPPDVITLGGGVQLPWQPATARPPLPSQLRAIRSGEPRLRSYFIYKISV